MLDQLEESKKTFGVKEQPRLAKLLTQLSRRRFAESGSLIQLHECLLFMLAYPQSKKLLNQTKKLLASFPNRIEYLKKVEADLAPFEEPEISGIAGTSLTVMPGYNFALWLSEHHTNEAEIDWEDYEDVERIGATLHRALPLLEEEAMVESHFPFLDYIHVAKSKRSKDLAWMMHAFSRFELTEKQKAELYESLKLYIRFTPSFKSSRSGLKLNVRNIFYHKEPLIQRRDISLEKELELPPLKIEKLPLKEGLEILDVIRSASFVRFRELHGFIWPDEKSFLKIDFGRGVIFYLNELSPANRLPLRAYHSGFIFKNGVPVGYIEGISLFEKMEVGFNHYYTYRDGETAWIFSQMLRVFHQHLGITVISIDPYQIGHENEEGIESGAFWFYRKLGFHPILDEVSEIVEREEKKMLVNKEYRTPANILRKIAKSHLLYAYTENGSNSIQQHRIQKQWKDFHFRNILLAIQRKMSQSFNGNVSKMRKEISQKVASLLGVDLKDLKQKEQEAFGNFALVLSLIPNILKWNKEEKELILEIIHAKANGTERNYLLLIQKHKQMCEALIKMGSGGL